MIATGPALERCELEKAHVLVVSFGRQHPKQPSALRYVVNATGLRDPLGHKTFKNEKLNGADDEVVNWVAEDPRVPALCDTFRLIVDLGYEAQGDDFVTIGVWDHQGKWIAPAVVESLANALEDGGYKVAVMHYGI